MLGSFIIGWMLVGLVFTVGVAIVEWKQGLHNTFTLQDLVMCLIIACLGPFFLVAYLMSLVAGGVERFWDWSENVHLLKKRRGKDATSPD
jgi:hypothetical protein